MTVTGIYVLPAPILVHESLFGKVSSFDFEGQPVEVILPSLDSEGSPVPPDMTQLEIPPGDGVDWIGAAPDPKENWIGSPPTPTSGRGVLQLRQVAVRLPSRSDPTGVGEYLDRWFDFIATWIEVRFDQDLNWNWPISYLETPGSNFKPSSPRDASSRLLIHWDTSVPLDDRDWEVLLRLSSAGQRPPLEEVLLRSAKSWERRRKNRLAVIDAGLAAEIAVEKLLRKNLSPSTKFKSKRFVDKINLIYAKNIPTQVSKESLHYLRTTRNDAVHEGIEVSAEALAWVILIANRVVKDIQDSVDS